MLKSFFALLTKLDVIAVFVSCDGHLWRAPLLSAGRPREGGVKEAVC